MNFKSDKWDTRFLSMARHISTWSKDPSTQVGAVVVRGKCSIIGLGFNGFATGLNDAPNLLADKQYKHSHIIHAETNALLSARQDTNGCAIYVWPLLPCPRCAAFIIQAGISRVVARLSQRETVCEGESLQLSRDLLAEANVCITEIP